MRNNSDCIAGRIGDARPHLRLLPVCMQISRSKAFASPTGTEIELAILVEGQIVKVMRNSADGSFLRIVDSSTLCLCKESHTDRSQKDSGACQRVPLFWSQGGRQLLCRRLRGRRGRRTLTLTRAPYLLLPFAPSLRHLHLDYFPSQASDYGKKCHHCTRAHKDPAQTYLDKRPGDGV